ncbi:Hypothetical predicted protein [Cloeon dipterum]|uniref:Uncharacterized protein n=1 Tax=Cloeon dipterum TaxID=197152 RepID=A0A8S1BS34_9INSE|nr:Hypothetical predicted protein [Cloeon dipterum]
MKTNLVCLVLFLIAQPAAVKSLPIENETTTQESNIATPDAEDAKKLATTAGIETSTPEGVSTTEPAPTLTTTKAITMVNSSAVATIKPSNGFSTTTYSPVMNMIKNIGYGFRIILKLLAPLFSRSVNQREFVSPKGDDTPEYEDFDEQDSDDGSQNKALTNSFMRVVRQVAETGRQGYAGYYDFIVNEYSYKFWAAYMLFASGLLIYSAIAAIYYAKFNTSAVDYEIYDEARSMSTPGANPLGLVGSLISVHTFQQIMDAISSEKFS